MAKAGFYDYYKDLPSWAKGIVIVGGGAIVFLVGKRVYDKVFPTDQAKKNQELVNNISSEIKVAQSNGDKPTYLDSNYVTFANTAYNGMRYAVGDDYAAVESTLKSMKNNLDVAKLIAAFGNRQNYAFGIPVGNPMDLFTFVKSELGNEWGGLTSARVTSINKDWAAKGIKYQI
jgi:hypothetical protein